MWAAARVSAARGHLAAAMRGCELPPVGIWRHPVRTALKRAPVTQRTPAAAAGCILCRLSVLKGKPRAGTAGTLSRSAVTQPC